MKTLLLQRSWLIALYVVLISSAGSANAIFDEIKRDKERVATLSNDELRYELDYRWNRLWDKRVRPSPASLEKLVKCCARWASGYVGGIGGGLHSGWYEENLRKSIQPARIVFHFSDKFLQTGGRGVIAGSYLYGLGKYPNADREYFDCVYDLTIEAEIAAFGHIYQLSPQEEANIKTKAKADPLVKGAVQTAPSLAPKIKWQSLDEFKTEAEKMPNDQLMKLLTEYTDKMINAAKGLPKGIEPDVARSSTPEYNKPRLDIIKTEIEKRLRYYF